MRSRITSTQNPGSNSNSRSTSTALSQQAVSETESHLISAEGVLGTDVLSTTLLSTTQGNVPYSQDHLYPPVHRTSIPRSSTTTTHTTSTFWSRPQPQLPSNPHGGGSYSGSRREDEDDYNYGPYYNNNNNNNNNNNDREGNPWITSSETGSNIWNGPEYPEVTTSGTTTTTRREPTTTLQPASELKSF